MAPFQGAEFFFYMIEGWRPDKSGLTPSYLLSRLRRECPPATAGGSDRLPTANEFVPFEDITP